MREPGTENTRCRAPGFVCYKDLDGAHGLGLWAPVALRDLELHPLALFEGAVAIRLDGGEVNEHVPTTVDRDEAVALVRVEPFDGALSHYQQLPNFCSGFGFRPCNRGTRRSRSGPDVLHKTCLPFSPYRQRPDTTLQRA